MEEQRSPFGINKIELFVAISTIVGAWFGLHASISSFWPAYLNLETPLPDWVVDMRETLAQEWAIPITVILALSSIFLVRGTQNQNIKYFSRVSHFVLAWPLILFPSITLLYIFGLLCFPIGLTPPIFSIAESFRSRKWWESVFVTVWVVGCTVVAGYYFGRIDYLFGD